MIRELMSYLPQNNREDRAAAGVRPIRSTAWTRRSTRSCRAESNLPYDIKDVIRRVVDDGEFFEVQEHWAQNIVVGFARMDGRPVGIVAQSAGVSGGLPGYRFVGEGRALRALLRRVQHSDSDVRRRAGISARDGAGVRRHHPARREAAVRVRRGDRAEDHGDHAQGVRRRVLRDGVEAPAHGCELWRGRRRRSR